MRGKSDRVRMQGRVLGMIAGFFAGLAAMVIFLMVTSNILKMGTSRWITGIVYFAGAVPVYYFVRSHFYTKADKIAYTKEQESKKEAKAQIGTLTHYEVDKTQLELFGDEPTLEDLNMIKTGAAHIDVGETVEAYVGCMNTTKGKNQHCVVVITDKALYFIKTAKDYQPAHKPQHDRVSRETRVKADWSDFGEYSRISIRWKDNSRPKRVTLEIATQYNRQKRTMERKLEACLQQMSRN